MNRNILKKQKVEKDQSEKQTSLKGNIWKSISIKREKMKNDNSEKETRKMINLKKNSSEKDASEKGQF